MEALYIYFLKACGVLTLFFITYLLFLKRETFFNLNRYFLLGGALASLILPFIVLTKIIYVEAPKIDFSNLETVAGNDIIKDSFNWSSVLFILYLAGLVFFMGRFLVQLYSLYRLIKRGTVTKEGRYYMVSVTEDTAPFSFFNYIVHNPEMHHGTALKAIITHEKAHVDQWHSLDIMLMHLYTIIVWINPLAWMYKKRVAQNLEYIADHKTVSQATSKKEYQYLLLNTSAGNHQSSITNTFFNSSIKKRIVMLQQSKSDQKNVWKYSLILPLLVGFIFVFNTKTVAQGKEKVEAQSSSSEISITINKDATNQFLKDKMDILKKTRGLDLQFLNIKRNSKGEITSILSTFKDKMGSGSWSANGEDPIKPFSFFIQEGVIGYSSNNNNIDTYNKDSSEVSLLKKNSSVTTYRTEASLIVIDGQIQENYSPDTIDIEKVDHLNILKGEEAIKKYGEKGENGVIEVTTKKSKNALNFPSVVVRQAETLGADTSQIKKDALIIIDGKEQKKGFDISKIDPNEIESVTVLKNKNATTTYGEKGKEGVILITTKKAIQNPWKVSAGVMPVNGKQPLIAIDRVLQEKDFDINTVDPKDMGSATVIKGNTASEKYGKKASDGVIEITTEKAIQNDTYFIINKNTSGTSLALYKKRFKEQGITCKISHVERNPKGEITAIDIELSDKKDKVGATWDTSRNPDGIPDILIGTVRGTLRAATNK